MPSHPPIPPLLSQYISHIPSSSLTLLTSTLAATTNWLVLRFIHAALKPAALDEPDHVSADTKVILVSWLRNGNFWKDGGKKLGINFQKIQLVDALSNGLGMSTGGLAEAEKEVLTLVKSAKEPSGGETRVLLVLDGMDYLIAATACPVPAVIDMVGEFREVRSYLAIMYIKVYQSNTHCPLPARGFNNHHILRRLRPDAIALHASRSLTRSFCHGHGASSEADNECEGFRYRSCQRYQWCSED